MSHIVQFDRARSPHRVSRQVHEMGDGLRMVRDTPLAPQFRTTHMLNSFILTSRLYYQYKEERTSACTATIHAIIHLPTEIWNCGPAWVHWAFVMEREVQWCKAQVRNSRKEPFAHLTRKELHREQIRTITLRFDLEDELDIRKRVKGDRDGPKGTTYNSCTYWPCYLTVLNPLCADDDYEFLLPSKRNVQLTDNMREEIAQFVVANHDPSLPVISEAQAMRCVPRDGVKWGKMTVNGERITASWVYRSEKYQRRANYIRVGVSYDQKHVIVANTCVQ